MSYIRWGAKLPSGKLSHSFVIGEDTHLINLSGGNKNTDAIIPYVELRKLFKTKTYEQITKIIQKRLFLEKEEADYVCESLFEEHKNGEWDKPFDFEKKARKKL